MDSLVFSIIQSASVVIASTVAIIGITSWRNEAKWKRKYELAEEVLALFYECKEKIQIIRSPFGNTSEGKSRKKRDNETDEEAARLDNAYVVYERYEKEKETFSKLYSLKFRFMTLFGKQSEKPFDEIKKILNTIFFASNNLGQRYWKDQGRRQFTDAEFQKHLKEMHNYESIIYGHYDDDDDIAKQVNNCIQEIENYCKTIMIT
jgi:hypothetical protein